MIYCILFLIFIFYTNGLIFFNIRMFLDLKFYKAHNLKIFEVFRYKVVELLLLDQYIKRHKRKKEKSIIEKVSHDLYYIYCEYFRRSKK